MDNYNSACNGVKDPAVPIAVQSHSDSQIELMVALKVKGTPCT